MFLKNTTLVIKIQLLGLLNTVFPGMSLFLEFAEFRDFLSTSAITFLNRRKKKFEVKRFYVKLERCLQGNVSPHISYTTQLHTAAGYTESVIIVIPIFLVFACLLNTILLTSGSKQCNGMMYCKFCIRDVRPPEISGIPEIGSCQKILRKCQKKSQI